jgi:hypothetical protein
VIARELDWGPDLFAVAAEDQVPVVDSADVALDAELA